LICPPVSITVLLEPTSAFAALSEFVMMVGPLFSRGIRACLTRYALDPAACALVGDQIFTDVLGANCAGVQSILISAIHNHTIWLKLRHVAELPFIAIGKWRIRHEKH